MKRFLGGVLALLQVILCSIGFTPVDQNVDYGGTPYEPPQITTPMTIVQNGRSDFAVVIPDGADAAVRTAAGGDACSQVRRPAPR